MSDSLQLGCLAALLAACCWTDLRTGAIPNRLTLGGAVLGALLALRTSGAPGAGQALLGWLAALAVLLPVYAFVGMGGGDVKLLAAVGAFGGAGFFLMALFHTLMLGLLVAVPVLLVRGRLGAVVSRSAWTGFLLMEGLRPATASEPAPEAARDTFPVALLIAAGTFLTWYEPAFTRWISPLP